MEKVCKVPSIDKKILKELFERREGSRVKTLMRNLDLKQSHVYKRLNLLRDKGLVQNMFPVWKIVNGRLDSVKSLIKDDNIFELHNISYVVKLLKTPDWWSRRKNYLMRVKEYQFKNINFGKGGSNPFQQLMNDNFVIQAYPQSLIIIARKRYYSNNPYETIQEAIKDIVDLIEWFCERMRFNFFIDGVEHIAVRNNDFNRMNDAIANEIKRQKGSFLVEIDKRREVWVDMSEPFGKEANYPEGQEILEKVTKDYLTKPSLLPSEIGDLVGQTALQIKQVTQNQSMFNKNFETHVEAIKTLSKFVKELQKEIRGLKEYRKRRNT